MMTASVISNTDGKFLEVVVDSLKLIRTVLYLV